MSDRAARITAEAEALRESLAAADSVTRAEIAGSIRRRASEPRDIEIVCRARWGVDLLGNWTEHTVDRDWIQPVAIAERAYRRIKGGGGEARYVQMEREFKLDLFISAADNHGLIMAIRTGPAAFSRAIAQRANSLGMHMHNGRLCRGYRAGLGDNSGACVAYDPIPTPEEDDVFSVLRVCWVSPPERGDVALEPSGIKVLP